MRASAVEFTVVVFGLGLLLSGCNRSTGYEEQRKSWVRYSEVGQEKLAAGDVPKALEAHERAVAIVERTRGDYPNDLTLDVALADAHWRYGGSLHYMARFDESRAALEKGLATMREAARRDDQPRVQRSLALLLHAMARARLVACEVDEALLAVEESKRILSEQKEQNELPPAFFNFYQSLDLSIAFAKAAKVASEDWPAVQSLSPNDQHSAHYTRVWRLLEQDDLNAALGAIDDWSRLPPNFGEPFYALACANGLIVWEIETQHPKPNEEQRALLEKHAAATLTTLQAAIDAGYSRNEARYEVDFISLRDRPAFRKLVGMENAKAN